MMMISPLLWIAAATLGQVDRFWTDKQYCGGWAVLHAAWLLEKNVDETCVAEVLPPDGRPKTLAELLAALTQLKIPAFARHFRSARLPLDLRPLIVPLVRQESEVRHFVVVVPGKGAEVLVLDGRHQPLHLARAKVEACWDGAALVVGAPYWWERESGVPRCIGVTVGLGMLGAGVLVQRRIRKRKLAP